MTAVVLLASAAGVPSGRVAVDPSQMAATDSLGNRYPAGYVELSGADGYAVGSVTLHKVANGPRTLFLELTGVRVGGARLAGNWKVGLVKQLVDSPAPGRLTGSFGFHPLPVNVGGAAFGYSFFGGSPSGPLASVTVERPLTPPTVLRVKVDPVTGNPSTLSEQEFETATRPPSGLPALGTPRDDAPVR